MKAAYFRRGGKFEVIDCPTPEPGPGEALVKVHYCGICGSDLHMVDGGMLPPDCIIGHELSGTVAAVGPGVEGHKEGDRVVIMPLDPCMSCAQCRQGNTQLCAEGMKRNYGLGILPGAFAQYMLVKPSMIFNMPDGLDMKTAAINEPWAVAVHAVDALDLFGDSLVLVMGAGPIGLLVLFALKRAGVENVYVSEPDPFRADKAAQTGPKMVINPKKDNPATIIPREEGRPPEIVFDCVGIKNSTQDASAIVGPKGKVLVLGVHMGPISIIPIICFAKEVAFIFSLGYQQQEFADTLGLLAGGAVDTEVIISDVMPLSGIGEAFDLLRQSGHTKILIDCQA